MNQNRLPRREVVSAARRAEMLNEAWGRQPRQTNFLDDWEIPFAATKTVKRGFAVIVGIWVLSVLAGLVVTGLVIWGGIEGILWLRDQ
jgi:hypothetical protein